jgi:mono/diheme cytochrome c family protein
MKKILLPLAITLSVAALASRPATVAHANDVRKFLLATVWDSVYTDSQTVRGDSLYQAVCVKCHGPDLAGTADGNPLTGADFMGNWDGLTIDQLYDRIRNEMPPDNPKTIPRELVPDVMAYIFKRNNFPAGTKPLPEDAAKLKEIKITKTKPAG